MVELIAKTPCEGLLPLRIGAVHLTELTPEAITSLAPYSGQDKALSAALKSAHGMALPAKGRATGKEGKRVIWFGQGQVMLMGPPPSASLAEHAAITDQSDAWAVVRIEGTQAVDVLARLAPVDLRIPAFKRGHSVRTQLQHMMVSITGIGENAFVLLAFRSMAQTLVHELTEAMKGVSARGVN